MPAHDAPSSSEQGMQAHHQPVAPGQLLRYKYQLHWRDNHPWLAYDRKHNALFCIACTARNCCTKWVPGAVHGLPHGATFTWGPQLCNVTTHANEDCHKKALEVQANKQPEIAPTLRRVQSEWERQLLHVFNTAYMIAK